MKNIFKKTVIEAKVNDNDEEIIKEDAEMNVKTGWSLKKKLLLGGGVLVGLVVGAVALGSKKSTPADEAVVEVTEIGSTDVETIPDEASDEEEKAQ